MTTIPKTHLFTEEDLVLLELPQIFSAGSTWLECGMKNQIATFDIVIRDMPKNRNFLVFGGLEEIVQIVKKLKYSREEAKQLLDAGAITPKFAKYLETFRFTGNIHAMREGTIFFPGEPIVRVEAPIIEANLLTMLLMIAVPSNTAQLSKVIRSVIAKKDKILVTGGGMRASSFESALKFARSCYIANVDVGSKTIGSFAKKFNLKQEAVYTNVYHALIKSFPSEIEAMRKMANLFKGKVNIMIDTYNMKTGLENFIKVCKECRDKKMTLPKVIIDSGDLIKETKKVRKKLDKSGLKDVKISVAGNLDEFKIFNFVKKKVPADSFLVHTEVLSVADDPKLEVVYKLAESRNGKKIKNVAKFSKGKESYPGRKQVFRQTESDKIKEDIVGLEGENLENPLLLKIFENGKLVYELPSLDEIRNHLKKEILTLPEKYLSIEKQYTPPVKISKELQKLFLKVKREHVKS